MEGTILSSQLMSERVPSSGRRPGGPGRMNRVVWRRSASAGAHGVQGLAHLAQHRLELAGDHLGALGVLGDTTDQRRADDDAIGHLAHLDRKSTRLNSS